MLRKLQIHKRKKAYQKAFKKHGVGIKALQWYSEEAATVRYQNLVTDIHFNNKSVCDIGCGFGDIIPFIKNRAEKFTYTGIDIVPEFIEEAKKRHPGHRFVLGDYKKHLNTFDVVLCSGVLNRKVRDPYKERQAEIEFMFKRCKEAFAFNMTGSHPQPENKRSNKVYYVDSLWILEFCMSLTSKIILRHHYRKKDFTVVMFRR